MFCKKQKYGGLIAYLGLQDFWVNLSEDERQFIRECYTKGLSSGTRNPKEVDNPEVKTSTSQTASAFLNTYATWAINAKRYDLADKLSQEALKKNQNVIERHYTYNHLIDLYYKQRDKGPEFIQKCIEYCKADIEMFPEFRDAWLTQERSRLISLAKSEFTSERDKKRYLEELANLKFNLRIPSFERLAIIYEKQGKILEAIEVCELALKYELFDNTKGGFKGRMEKLRRKLTLNK